MESTGSKSKINWIRFRPGRRFYVFVISLILASGFWLLNALNKTYVEDVDIAIKYINLPENRAFSPVPVSSLKVALRGDGYSLYQIINEAEDDTVVVDLSELEFFKRGPRKVAYLPTTLIINELSSSLRNSVTVNRVSRDTIVVSTERGMEKIVPVRLQSEFSVAKGMVQKRPLFSDPDSIRITGPKSVISTIEFMETEVAQFGELSDNAYILVDLNYDHSFIKPDKGRVKVYAEIESLTEGEIEVPLTVVGVPDGIRVRLLPKAITIRYSTGLSHYDFIEPQLFNAVVHYGDVKNGLSKLPVTIQSYPSYVNIIQAFPERVDYLLMDTQNQPS